jgi:hypothetical protein
VNSPATELCPLVTADGKYLFFLSSRDGESHPYWVRADVIEKARPRPSASETLADNGCSIILYPGSIGNDDVCIRPRAGKSR